MTAAWLFVRHGRPQRARVLVETLVEEDPRDGVSAAALAELLLADGDGEEALRVLRMADFPVELMRAEAVLECRALTMVGRVTESKRRWNRYLEFRKGSARSWVEE
ncbi:MAG: tetratricopeptide repeat protein [Lentisphaeria bacterium]|nr:tetratricopeptide repeat protein [Lentisphaeria bacterium]